MINRSTCVTKCLFCFLFLDDHSRVKLKNSENDYINASLVIMKEAQRSYILSQVIGYFYICSVICSRFVHIA